MNEDSGPKRRPSSPSMAAEGSNRSPTLDHPTVTGLDHTHLPPRGAHLAKLSLAALGVVYGDIGTSPLYALKECVTPPHGVQPTPDNVLGVLSLIFWALALVVVVKYLVFVLRADNNGEGGVLALLALLRPERSTGPGARRSRALVIAAIVGAALLLGDGMITPAISVLGAMEGLHMAAPGFDRFVLPLSCLILIALFLVQKRGTGKIGAVFGPAMLVWFVCIALVALPAIIARPDVLASVNPIYAVRFFAHHGAKAFFVLASVVLCVTGGEALYADMGHFGRRAIRVAWYAVAYPGLLLNYWGQGALLLERPAASANPFYALAEGPWLYPMLVIATLAACIASQALISGAFSLVRQAIQMGYLPRLTIVHTSRMTQGQIYIPEVNALLMVGCLMVVLGFGSTSALASAYGIAVTGTMVITSVLFFAAVRYRWNWSLPAAGALLAFFLVVDLAFFSANIAKIAHGGWFPLLVAAFGFLIMTTWKRGRGILNERINAESLPLHLFLADIEITKPHRVAGTAVFMSSTRRGTPNVLLHHFKHNKVLHEKVVILNITTDDVPLVPRKKRLHHKDFGQGFYAVTAHYGFMETPKIMEIIRLCRQAGIDIQENDTSYFLGRETLVPARHPLMVGWRRRLFSFLSRNSRAATDFFGLPPNRVVELGTQIEL